MIKEKIENKINAVILFILDKDAKDISESEFNILSKRLSEIKLDEQNEETKKRMTALTNIIGGI